MKSSLQIKEPVGSEGWSVQVRRQARNLVTTIDQGYMQLAEIIHTVWSTPIEGNSNNACITESWGYRNYIQWAEEELNIDRRKAERLKAIWHHLHVRLGGKLDHRVQKKIVDLGWTKVRELIRVLDADNALKWVEVARGLNNKELRDAIRHALTAQEKQDQVEAVKGADKKEEDDEEDEWKGPLPPVDIDRFKEIRFKLTPEQKANVQFAIGRAKELAESDKPGHCLDMICTDFLATNTWGKSDDPDTIYRFFAKFERLTGKRLVVMDGESFRIEYGIDSLSKAAQLLEDSDE